MFDVSYHFIIFLEFIIETCSNVQILVIKVSFFLTFPCIFFMPLKLASRSYVLGCIVTIGGFILIEISWNFNWWDGADAGGDLLIYTSDLFNCLSVQQPLWFKHLDSLVQTTLGISQGITCFVRRCISKLIGRTIVIAVAFIPLFFSFWIGRIPIIL